MLMALPFWAQPTNAQQLIWDENPINAEIVIDSLETILPNQTGADRLALLNRLAELYWLVDPDFTIKYGSEALQIAKQEGDLSAEGMALINLCQGYLINDLYDKALDYGLQSLEVREQLDNQYDIAYSLRTLGWLYYDIRNFDKALDYHEQVLEIHRKLDDPEREAYSYNSLGLIYFQKGNYDTALAFLRQSLELKEPYGNQDRIAETLKNIGSCFSALDTYDSAIYSLSTSLDISREQNNEYNQSEALNELAKIYLKQEKFTEARAAFEEANQIIRNLNDNRELFAENSGIASEYFETLGDFKSALMYYQQYDSARAQILTEEKSHNLSEMQILYEAAKRENEIRLLEQSREADRQMTRALFVGFILIVIIAILIVGRMRSSMRKNKIIYNQNQQLVEAQLKNEELHSAKLEEKLEFRKKELTNLALFISQRNEIYENLSHTLSNLNFIDRDDYHKKINVFLKEYSARLNINEDLQKFHSNIDNVSDEFFYRIREEYPNLTENDVKLSAQLRLNLSSKEIAHLNNISVKSVEISRYRLRKKLNLDKKEILTDFLRNF